MIDLFYLPVEKSPCCSEGLAACRSVVTIDAIKGTFSCHALYITSTHQLCSSCMCKHDVCMSITKDTLFACQESHLITDTNDQSNTGSNVVLMVATDVQHTFRVCSELTLTLKKCTTPATSSSESVCATMQKQMFEVS